MRARVAGNVSARTNNARYRIAAARASRPALATARVQEGGVAAGFDRYSNSFLKIHFEIPAGREDEFARKVLMKHLIEGDSYGIQLKTKHAKFPQPMLGPWVEGSEIVGADWKPAVMEGWERPAGH